MAVTYEYVGKTGGGNKINRIDVPGYDTAAKVSGILATVPIPTGKTGKIAVGFTLGAGTTTSGSANFPTVNVGTAEIGMGGTTGRRGGGVFTSVGPTTVSHVRNSTAANANTTVSDFVILWWEEA